MIAEVNAQQSCVNISSRALILPRFHGFHSVGLTVIGWTIPQVFFRLWPGMYDGSRFSDDASRRHFWFRAGHI